MGIFWNYADEPPPSVVASFSEALAKAPPQGPALAQEAQTRAAAAAGVTPRASLNRLNLVVALGTVAVLLGAGIGTDAANLPNSSKAIYALATTAFGIVVGLLTGEKPKT
ncbi:MAG: hypothetical protein ACLQDY_17145 [Streptosporangiaceae bacterium]